MDWFKSYNGAPIDPKFQLIAHKAKLKVHEISLCWWVLMDHASGSANRGDVSNIDFESLDFFLQFESGTFERAFSAFVDRGMIIDDQISNWKKRQTNDSADRQRRYRENKKAKVDNVTDDDNECNALRNVTNASLEETRGEEKRVDKKESISSSARENEIVAEYTNIFLKTLNGHVGLIQNLSQDAKNTLVDIHRGLMKNDFDAWENVCKKVLEDDFYLGGGKNGWIITLQWLADENNVVKIMNRPASSKKTAPEKSMQQKMDEEAAFLVKWDKEKREREERMRNASK